MMLAEHAATDTELAMTLEKRNREQMAAVMNPIYKRLKARGVTVWNRRRDGNGPVPRTQSGKIWG